MKPSGISVLIGCLICFGPSGRSQQFSTSAVLVPSLPDTIRMYRSCEHDLTRDGHLETFQVTAVGVEWEKMQFRLNVLSHAGELLFSDEWTSQWYFAAPLRFNPYTPEGGERLITMRMDGMVDRPSFRIGFMDGGNPRNLRYAVRTELGDEATDDRVEALSSELSKALFYYYVKGHEDISALAWSRLENRLVLLSPVI